MQGNWRDKEKTIVWVAMVALLTALAIITYPTSSSQHPPAYYLYHGDVAMSDGNWKQAIELFENAIKTGNVASSAKAMAYWNIHLACENLNDKDCAPEALLGFIVHALDYLDFINSLDKLDRKFHPGTRWVKKYHINRKLKRAAFKIQHYWDNRNEQPTDDVCAGCNQ